MIPNIKYLIDFIALGAIYFIFFYRRWKNRGIGRFLVNTILFVYLSFVLYFTLMPVIVSIPFLFDHPYRPMNMHPFDDYLSGRGDTVRQILLNVILLVPFGFLLPLVKKQRFLTCAAWTFLFSLGIELIQPLLSGFRSSDITDLVTNTTGGILGYLLYLLFRPLTDAAMKRLKPNTAK